MSSEVESLTEALFKGAKIEDRLSFKNRQLKIDSPADAKQVTDAIEKSESIQVLELVGNTVSPQGAEIIGQALAKRPELKRALWSDIFTGRMKGEIPRALVSLCAGMMKAEVRLVELDLSDNAFSPAGAEAIQDFLRSKSAHTLQILKLNNNGLGPTGGKVIADALSDGLNASEKTDTPMRLRVFESGRGRLENPGAIALSDVFERMGSLEEISVPQNGIYHQGINALCTALCSNPNLRILNLQDNTITSKGAKGLAKMLEKLGKLEILNLNDCLLRERGVRAVLDALMQSDCTSLQRLSLEGNEIPGEMGIDLITELENLRELTYLALSANNFGTKLDEIMKMKKRSTIATVDLEEDDDAGSLDSEDENEEEFAPSDGEDGEGYTAEGEGEDQDDGWEDAGSEEDVVVDDVVEDVPAAGVIGQKSPKKRGESSEKLSDLMRKMNTSGGDGDGIGDELRDPSEWEEENWWVGVWEKERAERKRNRELSGIQRPMRDYGADGSMVARDFMKVAQTVTRTNESKALALARKHCDWMLKDAFRLVSGNEGTRKLKMEIVSYVMTGAGFIKDEYAKRDTIQRNNYGLLKVLEFIMAQPYMETSEKAVMLFAIERAPKESCFGVEDVVIGLKEVLSL